MKENIDTSSQQNNIILNLGNEEMFYFSESSLIPNNIKEDFKDKENFLLVFVNPKSGSQQGKIVLDHAEKYRIENIPGYNIIHFPIMDDKLRKRKSKELDSKISTEENLDNQPYTIKKYFIT